MWRNSACFVCKIIRKSRNLRSLSGLHSSPTESYLRLYGAEPLTDATLSDVLLKTVERYPTRVALKSVHEDITLTYEQLLNQADALAWSLRVQGLERGDRLGVWSHNSAGWIVAVLAAARAGLIAVLLNPAYEKPEISFCMKKTGVKGLYIGQSLPNRLYYEALRELIPSLPNSKPGEVSSELFPELTTIIATGNENLNGVFNLESLVKEYGNKDASRYCKDITSKDGCLIHLTSGTTGQPKAVLDSHYGVVNNTYFIGKRLGLHEYHHNFCMQAPMFHALGSIVTLIAGINHGSTITLASPIYNVTNNLNCIIKEKCSIITGTPTMFVDMLSELRSSGTREQSQLQTAMVAGAPCSPQLMRDMNKELNVQSVKTLYGLSESTACVLQSKPDDSMEIVADTVGFIQDHLELKVVDVNGAAVPWGEPGELLSRGYNTMIHYWDEPEKTQNTVSEDGWLSTGDKFILTPDGYGKIVGRLKDIIIRGGENIAPKEIEDLLNTHPDIIESQVIGVADERVGEEICCVLRVQPGASISLDDVTKHLHGRLARFKMPRLLRIADDFPKTTSGKVKKHKVKEMVEAGEL